MNDLSERLAAVVGAANVSVGDAIAEDYTHDEALGTDPVVPLAVVATRRHRRGRRGPRRRGRDRDPGHGARHGHRACPARALPREDGIVVVVRAHEPDPRDRHRRTTSRSCSRASRSTSSTRRTAAARPRVPGVPRREQREPRRQRRHERRRDARGEVRRDPPPGARARGGAGDRRGRSAPAASS